MRVVLGIDLGSTTTKAVMLDESGKTLGKGITNSRSNYHLAADLAQDQQLAGAERVAALDAVDHESIGLVILDVLFQQIDP